MRKHGIGEDKFVVFDTPYLDFGVSEAKKNKQFSKLAACIQSCRPLSLKKP